MGYREVDMSDAAPGSPRGPRLLFGVAWGGDMESQVYTVSRGLIAGNGASHRLQSQNDDLHLVGQ